METSKMKKLQEKRKAKHEGMVELVSTPVPGTSGQTSRKDHRNTQPSLRLQEIAQISNLICLSADRPHDR
ncbi:hypothetical protein V6N12_065226 [Hibiscus sabdariffa]|uniref:Uncharacterized protein n=1 Tax=Hibiscus sabdariffa TaxID=183260 RepID=A0ABR2G830_9ROSI